MVATALHSLEEAIDELHAVDFDALSDPELDDIAVGLARGRARLMAVSARAVGTWERRGIWTADGSRTAGARLSRDTNTSPAAANRELARARALLSMPATADAFSAGSISVEHVDVMTGLQQHRWRDLFVRDEAFLVEQAVALRFRPWTKVVAYWRQHADAETDGAADLSEQATLTASTTIDGLVHLNGVLDPIGGAMFVEALRRIERELFHHERRTEAPVRTAAQRRAHALVEMAVRATANGSDGTDDVERDYSNGDAGNAEPDDSDGHGRNAESGGDGGDGGDGRADAGAARRPPGRLRRRRPEPLVCILAGSDAVAKVCELSNGAVIAPDLIVPWLSEAQVQSFIFDDSGHVLSTSHVRTFGGRLRRAVQVRDRHCQHPSGCDVPITECDIDHTIPYARHPVTVSGRGA